MNEVIYLILREARRPALLLLGAYTIAILGMVSLPGLDEQGEPMRLSFAQAFYWVSYTATTIGYGELPQAYSEWQRLWVTFSIYYTVPAWFYAIGKIVALLQDTTFQQALREGRFTADVEKLKEKFCIICGFGESGQRLVHQLRNEGFQCVVIEKDASRVRKMSLDPLLDRVLALEADAEDVQTLERAGVRSPYCRAVVAITSDEKVNLKVALTANLLSSSHHQFKILCRTSTRAGSATAKALGNHVMVINTNRIFTERLIMALRRPSLADVLMRFHGQRGEVVEVPPKPPLGRWIICGNDSLGRTLKRFLDYEGVDHIVVDPRLENTSTTVQGMGTEAVTLRQARIDRAQAIVAAQSSDTDNLSIAMMAKNMDPSLFVVGKQNRSANRQLFAVAGFDRVMEEDELIVSQAFPYIARPLLWRFLTLVAHQDEGWGKRLLASLNVLCPDRNPYHALIRIEDNYAPAVLAELHSGRLLRMQTLWTHPHQPESVHDVLPLLLLRNGQETLLPSPATVLQKGDKILIAYGQSALDRRLRYTLFDESQLYYAIHGKEMIRSALLSYLKKRFD
ncbi:MAG: NAD-binding protein [Cardiobacteriaceae bacterium]|nr:NAD-binding protein [Cardiobacteriaceae bacterium]